MVFDITNSGNLLSGKEDIIFQSFYTCDNAGKEKGTGLGLSLVKKTVDKSGGQVEVKTNENTEFIVKLPLKSR